MQNSEKSPFLLCGKAPVFKIVLTAIMTAMAVVVKSILPVTIPLFGGGLKVGLAGIFTAFPALLLGPLWGGASSALCDFLSFLVNPQGGYQPLLTLTAFFGGCVKGLAYWFIVKYGYILKKNVTRIIVAVLLLGVGAYGVATHISITGDGITRGFIARDFEVPDKMLCEGGEYSCLTDKLLELSQYSFDSYTLVSIDEDVKSITLPAYAITETGNKNASQEFKQGEASKEELFEKYRLKITKIGDNLFSDCKNLTDVYVPSTYTDYGFSDTAFEGIEGRVTIHTSNEKVISYAQAHNIKYVLDENVQDGYINITNTELQSGLYKNTRFKLQSGYKSTVAEYANFLTIGLEIFAFGGLALLAVSVLIAKKKPKKFISGSGILFALIAGGLASAVPNVFILKYIVFDWAQKSTLVLMIPAVIEELCVRCVQAYIVWILFNALYNTVLRQENTVFEPANEEG
ncbi:MAG: ECF transporter S component [Clostridia bacterium]|nr:ECF transporter S component [Clostridia bacterium]